MRPLRLTILASGIILFIAAMVLAIARREPVPTHWMLYWAAKDRTTALYRAWPDGSFPQRLWMLDAVVDTTMTRSSGAWVYFSVYEYGTGGKGLYRAHASGYAPQRIGTLCPVCRFTVSPDDQWIFYAHSERATTDLYRMRPDGSFLQNLTQTPYPEFLSDLTPDGAWLVFTMMRDSSSDLYRMRPDGTQRESLTRDPAFIGYVDQASQWLLFLAMHDNNRTLHRMRLDGSGAEPLPSLLVNANFVRLSPDGTWLAFDVYLDSHAALFLIQPDGSAQRSLLSTRRGGRFHTLDWSPDGQWIVTTTSLQGNLDIYRIRPDGSQLQNLTHNKLAESFAGWLPFANRHYRPATLLGLALAVLGTGQGLRWVSQAV